MWRRAGVIGLGVGVGIFVLHAARPGQARDQRIGRVVPVDSVAGDHDGDGIQDQRELELAKSYFPYLSIAASDECSRHGVLFRLTPHPTDRTKLAIWYAVLYETDCGADSHPGDDEVFGALVDPNVAAPDGLLALRAISHQNTICEHTTTCGSLPGCTPCRTALRNGKPYPIVYASVNKHGSYADFGTCNRSYVCDFSGCQLNPDADSPVFVNAGEPGKPLTNNLTTSGFITREAGWTSAALFDYDPWAGAKFGKAGSVAEDLDDPAFLIAPSGC